MPVNPVQYIILNERAKMTAGKAAAQASHASVLGYKLSMAEHDEGSAWHLESNMIRLWEKGGHYAKVVLGTTADLKDIKEYIEARGFKCALVIDEGRTEINPFTCTAIGVEILDKNNPHVAATFGEFALYSDPRVTELRDAIQEHAAMYKQLLAEHDALKARLALHEQPTEAVELPREMLVLSARAAGKRASLPDFLRKFYDPTPIPMETD